MFAKLQKRHVRGFSFCHILFSISRKAVMPQQKNNEDVPKYKGSTLYFDTPSFPAGSISHSFPLTAARICFNRSLAKMKSVSFLFVESMMSLLCPCHSLLPS